VQSNIDPVLRSGASMADQEVQFMYDFSFVVPDDIFEDPD
jgi:hypothetical protein